MFDIYAFKYAHHTVNESLLILNKITSLVS